ncbi:acylphosphatase [Candidatus Bipolaricaulota bacterium]
MTRLEAQVHGLVQGVFFRHFTRQTAQALGIAGSVRNQANGTVLVVAEGSRHSLEALLEWLEHGPELARVDRVDAQWSQALGAQSDFSILR